MKVILCLIDNPAGIYLFKVNRTTRTRCVICSNVSIVNFGQVNAGSETSPEVVNKVNGICSAKCFFFFSTFLFFKFGSLRNWRLHSSDVKHNVFKVSTHTGFPKYYIFMGGTVPPSEGGTVNRLWGRGVRGGTDRGDFGLQKSNICKIRFCIFKTYMS